MNNNDFKIHITLIYLNSSKSRSFKLDIRVPHIEIKMQNVYLLSNRPRDPARNVRFTLLKITTLETAACV
jgi:hypothetical protein